MKKEVKLALLILLSACVLPSEDQSDGAVNNPDQDQRTVGFIGCSNTGQTLYGYRLAGGTKMWYVNQDTLHGYDGGSVIEWVRNDDFWELFDKHLAQNPNTNKVWWQLCISQDQADVTYDDALPVIEKLRKKIPDVKIYVSPLSEFPDHICEITGAEGIERSKSLAQELDESNGDVYNGPIVGPLYPREIRPQEDHCHPNEEGMGKMGRQLKEFFDDGIKSDNKVMQPNAKQPPPARGLGNLCSSEQECIKYCSDHNPECGDYCRGRDLDLCRLISPPRMEGHQNNRDCTGFGTIPFTSPPMHIEDIMMIQPLGLMIGGHVTPIDHGYYTAKTWKPGTQREPSAFADILAPAAGVVTSVQSMPAEYASSIVGDYRLVIHHTCSFYTIYIHVNQLSEKLQNIADKGKTVQVEAGEVIGQAPGFDFSVHNDEVTLLGFIVPETYVGESWKIHTVDMFHHFDEPTKAKLLERNVRIKEPRGGKIDHDIDGRLVGNWFEENTNGYVGRKEYQRMPGYWSTHLAFAYDGLDPDTLIVSMGDFKGEAKQFAVAGNAPDPATITPESGPITYELVGVEYETTEGDMWNRVSFAKIRRAFGTREIYGTVRVHMLSDRKMKFEAFPSKRASEIKEFTDKAKVYER